MKENAMYRFISKLYIWRLKKNEFTSIALRDYFKRRFKIDVGMYSYGCFDTGRIPQGTIIGRYCSFAPTCTIFNGNHPLQFITTHPYFYNPHLGIIQNEAIRRTICHVSDDVWIGHNAIILPSVTSIGRGSVVAAGAIVAKNVPPYSIVAGNPAKVIKTRFEDVIIEKIELSKWWELDLPDLMELIKETPELVFDPLKYFS